MPSAPDPFITYATLSPEGQDQHPNLAGLIFLVDHHHQLAWPSTCSPQHARARLAAINPPLSDTDLYRTLTANPDLTILNRAPAHRWRPGDKFIVAPDAPATQHIHPGQTVRLPFSFCPPTHSASPDDVIFVDDPNTSNTPGDVRKIHPILARHLISIHDYPSPTDFTPGDYVTFTDQHIHGSAIYRILAVTRPADPGAFVEYHLVRHPGLSPHTGTATPPNPVHAHHLKHASAQLPRQPNAHPHTQPAQPAEQRPEPAQPGAVKAILRINGVEVTIFAAPHDMPPLLKALTARTSRR